VYVCLCIKTWKDGIPSNVLSAKTCQQFPVVLRIGNNRAATRLAKPLVFLLPCSIQPIHSTLHSFFGVTLEEQETLVDASAFYVKNLPQVVAFFAPTCARFSVLETQSEGVCPYNQEVCVRTIRGCVSVCLKDNQRVCVPVRLTEQAVTCPHARRHPARTHSHKHTHKH